MSASSSSTLSEECTVMSVRSRITITSTEKIVPGPDITAKIIQSLSLVNSKAKAPDGEDVQGDWAQMLEEVAKLSKPQISGPFVDKDLERGNIYSLNMIIGGILDSQSGRAGKVMTLRTGGLYDTPNYHINGRSLAPKINKDASLEITATVATVKRPVPLCKQKIQDYIILLKVVINPPTTGRGRSG
ncbi:matrix protein [Citrus leprosis virus N]|uniref:Matrix protein n=1 Tax=Citrus leprosis virus N TaxID=1956177 RepID=A0A1W6AWM5_9RHAB|nr:matrix protein [Citrus leprosis virus N]